MSQRRVCSPANRVVVLLEIVGNLVPVGVRRIAGRRTITLRPRWRQPVPARMCDACSWIGRYIFAIRRDRRGAVDLQQAGGMVEAEEVQLAPRRRVVGAARVVE